ncbi:Flagellar hook protein FlgE [Thalassocella blandensis]|nr:Flagellar hook protein FlgE [Thalassocella blandensis]
MPFDTALSGIRAASTDLSVTGNNIANASTTGFKSSRAEFGDVYATSVLGAGNTAVGSGVQVQDVAQRFTQGNVAFTEKELDLAINGTGFFVINQGGETQYTRAGSFGLDSEGYIVNANDARLQGFQADASGNIGGIAGDVQLQTSNLDPRRSTLVESVLNLDASEPVLQSIGHQFETDGVDIGVTQGGLQNATSTEWFGNNFTLPIASPPYDGNPVEFQVDLSGQGTNLGTVSISLDPALIPTTATASLNDIRNMVSAINAQIFNPPTAGETTIDVAADVVVDTSGATPQYSISFTAVEEGLAQTISITDVSGNIDAIGLDGAIASTSGVPAVDNGYPAQAIDIVSPDGTTVTYNFRQGDTAALSASELNALQGVSATAETDLTITNFNSNLPNDLRMTLNGVTLTGATLAEIEVEINSLTNTTLPGVTATFDAAAGTMALHSAGGDDLRISISGNAGDSITVLGDPDDLEQTLEVNPAPASTNLDAADSAIVVGGSLNITLEEGYDIDYTPGARLQPISNDMFTDVVINEFDPADQATYNSATSMTIYDSLGVDHVLTQYFVKQDYDPTDPTAVPNHWQVHLMIDGADVGDPDTSLPAPDNTVATRATYDIYFNDDGTLNELLTDPILVSNWVPLDEDGNPSSAAGPQNVLAGGSIPLPEPPSSSNFVVDFTGTTQFGAEFSVDDVDQNGYATGRLSGLSIDDSGVIFARFTNGESQILGQVALASFPNQDGLQPIGNSAWVENFASGQPRIAGANSGSLGAIQSGALEESNVDISAELVKLIIAQRNFQASAKTIETADTVTQTIINLR